MALAQLGMDAQFGTADDQRLHGKAWIQQQWEAARSLDKEVLVIDEIQKIEGWSETVKRLWDEDTRRKSPLKVVFLGSSALLIEQGLTESLAGRFEVIRVPHWDFSETTVSRDILLHARIEKPALLRRLFQLVCEYSSQILSYQKMVGQLQDVGNTTTLAHYLRLLEGAGLCRGLQKYEGRKHRLRSSIPKLQVFNTALVSAQADFTLAEAKADPQYWGRLVESAVGARLLNHAVVAGGEVGYWRDGNHEVDFVIQGSGQGGGAGIVAIEVKSGRKRQALPGMEKFLAKHPRAKPLLVGEGGIALKDFFTTPLARLLER